MDKAGALRAAVISHKGCERDNNEDNFFLNGDWMPLEKMDEGAFVAQEFSRPRQLFAVCDGMGGESMGERAAYLCVRLARRLLRRMDPERLTAQISRYVSDACDAILADARRAHAGTAGTTLALAAFCGEDVWVANVGDSRVYLLRGGELRQVSFDHSRVNEMHLAGLLTEEEARKHPESNIITRYVGMDGVKGEDFVSQQQMKTLPGDRWLLCSDGLSDLLPRKQIEEILAAAESARDAARALTLTALELGGRDNVTVMVIEAA